ncbi:MAG: hypothetical protein IPO23_08495 [Flavobacterium sp.]|jgi:hypothetical protein|nr:hypothetical protein [Flavobacterium sp.]
MKKLLFILCVLAILLSCTSKKPNVVNTEITKIVQNDTIRIANDTLEYEVIIIDPGFTTWLNSVARPRNFYSLPFLENKNYLFVTEWNIRALQPQRYDPNLYEMRIDYDSNIHYGYEVNYLLYNYFMYFQRKYNQKL